MAIDAGLVTQEIEKAEPLLHQPAPIGYGSLRLGQYDGSFRILESGDQYLGHERPDLLAGKIDNGHHLPADQLFAGIAHRDWTDDLRTPISGPKSIHSL